MKTPPRQRYYALSAYLRERFGRRVRKIPLDAGFTCPNRDGTLSRSGCAFCNPAGSGTGLLAEGLDLPAQWAYWLKRFGAGEDDLFLAYLQSYSNTHGPIEKLRAALAALRGLPGMAGLCIGTRPDSLDEAKLDLLAAFPADEIHLDLGLQSSNDETLARIDRGHDASCFARMAEAAAARGLKVVAHVMAGLPGESGEDFLKTVDFVSALPVHGIKLHNTLVCRGTKLSHLFEQGTYTPLAMQDYARLAARALSRLRPDIVVHRLNADPAEGELLAPAWAGNKQAVLAAIRAEMERTHLSQGMNCKK